MKRIALALITALIWTTAAANNAPTLSLIFASEMNATMGCAAREAIQEQGGDCWTLNSGGNLHEAYINLIFSQFSDLNAVGPWHSDGDGGLFRLFRIDDDESGYAVLLVDHGNRESTGAIVPFN